MRIRVALSVLLLVVVGCKKEPVAVAPVDAAPPPAASSAEPPPPPVTPWCDRAACDDKCTCGEASACTAGKCVRDAAWKVEELALGAGTFACARYTNGKVQCAGKNAMAQLGRGTRTSPTAVNPPDESPASVKGVTDATRLVAGTAHACALVKDGHVWCWGTSKQGETGAGAFDESTTARVVADLDDATTLAAGYSHTCAIKKAGSVVCWGFNDRGQLGDGTKENRATPVVVQGLTGATRLALALHHSCALAAGGTVTCWGQRGGANGIAAPLPAVPKSDLLAVNQDEVCVGTGGKVSCYGPSMKKTLVPVPGFTDATYIAGGDGLFCAFKKNTSVTCGDWWAAADGAVTDKAKEARLVAVGGSFECIVAKDDTITCNEKLRPRAVIERL